MTTKERPPARLVNIALNELSLVDRGANPHAKVVLHKRADDEQEQQMRIVKIEREEPVAFDSLEEAMQHLQKTGMARSDAMSEAARAHPGLIAKYRQQGEATVAKIAEDVAPRTNPAITTFEAAVAEAEHQYGCSRFAAMAHVARARPDLYSAYQGVDPRVPSGRGPLT